MSDKVYQYLQQLYHWSNEAKVLRNILLDTALDEEWKWSSPCYTWNRKNIVIIAITKSYLGLNFFNGSLLTDKEKVLVAHGKDSQATRILKFSNIEQITKQKSLIQTYVAESINLERSGAKVNFTAKDSLVLPEDI